MIYLSVIVKKYQRNNTIVNWNGGFASKIETTLTKVMPKREMFLEIYGIANTLANKNVISVDQLKIIRLDNGYLVSTAKKANIDYNIKKIKELEQVCISKGIDFVYINYPLKLDNETVIFSKGYENYGISNGERLLNELKSTGVLILDMRELLTEKYHNIYSAFYKTDHHWTTMAALFGTQKIVEYLNSTLHYSLNEGAIDDSQLDFTHFKDAWLGESGRAVSRSYCGLDDFTLIKPKYKVHMECLSLEDELIAKGDFSLLVNEDVYNNVRDYYGSKSWHYSYLPYGSNNRIIRNVDNTSGKKILLIKDSFSVVVAPFLALSCSEIALWDMREEHEYGLYEYIEKSDFDAVIVAYMEGCLNVEAMFAFD